MKPFLLVRDRKYKLLSGEEVVFLEVRGDSAVVYQADDRKNTFEVHCDDIIEEADPRWKTFF